VLRLSALFAVMFLCLQSGSTAAAPTGETPRQLLQDVAVRIEATTLNARGLCTGWIGWSEASRSVVYTAAHCYEDGASYRVILGSGDRISVIGLTRWDQEDLMALWIPVGGLRALRMWKPLPGLAFRTLHVVNTPGAAQQIVETAIERVFSEIRFHNHPAAVAIPVYSAPGTSGAPLVDAKDGVLLGMVVGHLSERRTVSAVIPAQFLHDLLSKATPRPPGIHR
jgi:hypothetical protein